jgi:alanyl-tRNA synthetase
MTTSAQIRAGFLDFFARRGHRIVPSAPVIPFDDPTLLFTNAGMNQFKDVFLGTGRRDYARAADTQKCIRVSGKHNDLEEVGRDTYHHTFFEMLGNWSFGDYYKPEAIAWAWELLTKEWGLEKRRLYATVFESDDEAAELWRSVTDIDPSHIMRFGRKDNFWEMGDTGPCGPCSEIHIDLTPDRSGAPLVNAGDPRVMEIWNLVFIQYNRREDGALEPLAARHVDTGMGFERVCAVLQGKSSNYDTDVFTPILDAVSRISGRAYEGEEAQVAMRVIADHARMLTFSVADGAIPGNEGRGYVLRRILRRAARFGRTLGMHEPFLHRVAGSVVGTMGTAFPEIVEKRAHIERVIRAEEESFNTTLDRGLELFSAMVDRAGHATVFPGEDAFRLFDTYGFPRDLTRLLAQERGMTVDEQGFDDLMEAQRKRSRSGGSFATVGESGATPAILLPDGRSSTFVGYRDLEAETVVVQAEDRAVVLERSPFYAESGGQVGDTGTIRLGGTTLTVVDTRKGPGGIHVAYTDRPAVQFVGLPAAAAVDGARRRDIQRNHSATHLVHEALRRVLGVHVHQQGSLVAPDRLRFDFPHFGRITPAELRAVEEMVNARILEDVPVVVEPDLPIEEARTIPGVKMFFGDKYGDRVRVVFIDERFSVEFCGGTHVPSTRDIGWFKIVAESSTASGVRRIEAVTGEGVHRYIEEQIARIGAADRRIDQLLREQDALVAVLRDRETAAPPPVQRPALADVGAGKDDPPAALARTEAALAERAGEEERIASAVHELRKLASRSNVANAAAAIPALVGNAARVSGIRVVAARVPAATMDELKDLGDALRSALGSGAGVLAAVIEGKAAIVAVVTDDLVASKRLNAGAVVNAVARMLGGGGGGKAHMATAGARDTARLDEALTGAPALIGGQLTEAR